MEKSERELDLMGIQVGIPQITVAISLLLSADVNPWRATRIALLLSVIYCLLSLDCDPLRGEVALTTSGLVPEGAA